MLWLCVEGVKKRESSYTVGWTVNWCSHCGEEYGSSSEKLKSLSMNGKEESEKVGLKLNIQKAKIMASSPITSWQIDGETVADFIFEGAPKSLQMVTAARKLKDIYSLEGKL